MHIFMHLHARSRQWHLLTVHMMIMLFIVNSMMMCMCQNSCVPCSDCTNLEPCLSPLLRYNGDCTFTYLNNFLSLGSFNTFFIYDVYGAIQGKKLFFLMHHNWYSSSTSGLMYAIPVSPVVSCPKGKDLKPRYIGP